MRAFVYLFSAPQGEGRGCWELEDRPGEAPAEASRDGREDFRSEENLPARELPVPGSQRAGLRHRPGEGRNGHQALNLHPLRLPAAQAVPSQTRTLLLGHGLGGHPG